MLIGYRNRLQVRSDPPEEKTSLAFLSLFFCLGSALGVLVAWRFPALSFSRLGVIPADVSFFRILWRYSWPCLLVLFLASSYAGSFFLSAVFFGRGFLLSACCFLFCLSGAGLPSLLHDIGLCAAFSVPALFLLGEKALGSSRRLFSMCSGAFLSGGLRFPFVRIFVSVLLLILAAASRRLLIPLLR